ncbi:Adaptive-response sensory-kinase SasA [Paraburkholderia caffeinitolerans]|uniref:histidine kinase n=1 Tax=Paraburkholderia caffeinitolerans TaxID=1723730 RepID=A0A6J5FZ08_9BURK|nr:MULTISPECIES: sensor histidine kinase [Paraburkholderia]CAB3787512.1 Adaptive-response sensory-kinase SasA [Paraburkholderia caffeinitolerans]
MVHSLRARLLLWLLLPLAAFTVVTGAMSYDAARQTADLLQDNSLLASARTIIEDVDWENGALVANIPPAALEMFESPYQDRVFYKVLAGDGRLLGGAPELAPPSASAQSSTQLPAFYDSQYDGAPIRAVAYERMLYDSGRAERVTVIVGKTVASRQAMIDGLWRPQLMRQWLMLALAALLVPLGLTLELRPLMKLKNDVADREPTELEPIRPDHLPSELRPIVDAINQCIARLKVHASTQRQFIADAAHQLRTPLTLLATQIQFASQCDAQDPALFVALNGVRRTSQKMAELTSQLLLLAQAESMAPARMGTCVDLGAVVSSVLEELIQAAQQRDIDLGAELDSGVVVAGNAGLLASLAANLVDNAIRYTQAGGNVTAICRREGDEVVLQVVDNGPGIPAEARMHVFERFYRVATDTEGTGLGLAIVHQVARSHGGTVSVGPGAGRIGLVVTVRLPVWREVAARSGGSKERHGMLETALT